MIYDPFLLIDRRFRRHPDGSVVSDNERLVLRELQRHPGLSRADLTSRFDLRQQSLHRIVDQLVARGIVRMGPPRMNNGRGQPSPTLALRPGFAHVWGISLNTDEVGLALMDFGGTHLYHDRIALNGRSRDDVLAAISERMQAVTRDRGLDAGNCLGVGFGIAGYWVGGTRFNAPEPLAEWSLVELGPLLSQRFGLPVWVGNGANLSAMAESMLGAGNDYRTFAYISFNYGMGGGLIHDGQLWEGGNGNAGELSGMYGPTEMADRPALSGLLAHLRDFGVPVQSVAQILDRYDPHWPGLDRWIDRVLPAFNRLIGALWAVFDPQAIVLGGELPPDLGRRLLQRSVLHPAMRYGVPRAAPKLVVSDLGSAAGALGAAVYPLRLCAL